MSILALKTYRDAYNFFTSVSGFDLVMKLKVDGQNNKILLKRINENEALSELKLALSRGRSGEGFDYTRGLLRVVPRYFKGLPNEVKVFSEGYVEFDKLDYFRGKYGKPNGYVMPKTAAGSLLRVDHEPEDYKYLHSLAFTAEGLGNTHMEVMANLQDLGLETVPYFKVVASEVPRDFKEFCAWLKEKLDLMYQLGKNIPSDGVVVEVDDMTFTGVQTNQYLSRNAALKMEQWAFDYYRGVVKEIVITQRTVKASCRLKIEPMQTKDRAKAQIINSYNTDILMSEGIVEGSEIYFKRDSGAINVFVYGEELRQLKGQ